MVTVLAPLILVAVVVVIVVSTKNKRQGPPNQFYGPPGGYPPPGPGPQGYGPPGYAPPPPGYPSQGYAPPQPPGYPPQPPLPPQQPPPPAAMPPGYQPQPQDQVVTAANGYQLLLPQFAPGQQAIISLAVVAQGKVWFRAMPNGTGVFGGGLDIISGRRQPTEDVLTSVRRILAEETGGLTGRPLATVGHAQWDLGSGQENEVCYAVLLDIQPGAPLPAVGMTTWASRQDLATFRDLGPRAPVACDFADKALSAAGV
ncbi:NUDIX hydrolase [Kibdelosporangium persicum]|uniref:Nudix hydrolase domain-containing protein n=2 Tax=Kibdelosporangium persicum TaxID=2698649 RepID=A0ABX2FDG5_9PSEU|nr:hypothetical protein [Kibdelosporangium persicum]